jgi:hypothetical protein
MRVAGVAVRRTSGVSSAILVRHVKAELLRGDAQRGGKPAEDTSIGQRDDAALVPRHFGRRVTDPGT